MKFIIITLMITFFSIQAFSFPGQQKIIQFITSPGTVEVVVLPDFPIDNNKLGNCFNSGSTCYLKLDDSKKPVLTIGSVTYDLYLVQATGCSTESEVSNCDNATGVLISGAYNSEFDVFLHINRKDIKFEGNRYPYSVVKRY